MWGKLRSGPCLASCTVRPAYVEDSGILGSELRRSVSGCRRFEGPSYARSYPRRLESTVHRCENFKFAQIIVRSVEANREERKGNCETICRRYCGIYLENNWNKVRKMCSHSENSAQSEPYLEPDEACTHPSAGFPEVLFRCVLRTAKYDYQLLHVRPSVRTGQLGSYWTAFHEIWTEDFSKICRKKFQVSSKYDRKNVYFTWRPMYYL